MLDTALLAPSHNVQSNEPKTVPRHIARILSCDGTYSVEEVYVGVGWRGWESAMSHQYKAGDVVTIFQISQSKKLVIEGKATIRKRVIDVDEQYKVEFANKPGMTYDRFVDTWGQDDPVQYLHDFNRRSAGLAVNRFGK